MPISYISNVDSLRYAQLYRLQELLRIEHNKEGAKYKAGIITKQQWLNYLTNNFNPKQDLIVDEILKYRTKIKNDLSINTTLNDVII